MTVCIQERDIFGWPQGGEWNASYRQDVPLSGDFYVRFTVPPGVAGVVIGLNAQSVTPSYLDISYGLMFWQQDIFPVSSGSIANRWSGVNDDDKYEYTILRVGSQVYATRVDTLNLPTGPTFYPESGDVPIYGELIYAFPVQTLSAMSIDSSVFGIGDTFCLVEFAGGGTDPNYLTLNSGTTSGELPLEGLASTRDSAAPALTGAMSTQSGGRLGLTGEAEAGGMEGVTNGTAKLYLQGFASDTTFESYALGTLGFAGGLDNEIVGVGGIAQDQSGYAEVTGYLGIQGFASGDEFVPVNALGDIPLEGIAAGRASLDDPISAFGWGDLPIKGVAITSTVYDNALLITLPALGGSQLYTDIELTDEIRAAISAQARYAIMVREFIDFADTWSRGGSTQAVEVLDNAYAVATTMPQFSLWIQDTFNITDTSGLSVVQVVQLAEAVVAAGIVQTVYQGVVAVLSAVLLSDGGAGANPVGSGAILDATGVSGDPAEIALYGWFPTGSVLGISYTTNIGPGSVSYTLIQHQTGEQVAERLVSLLNAEPYLSSTYAGSGVIQILPANGATVVNI